MAVPNDTTKFELAWLIIWILVSFALLALAVLRKLSLPSQPALRSSSLPLGYIFAFLQLAIFAMYLAAMAHDSWSRLKGSDYSFGVTGNHWEGPSDHYTMYDCDGYSGDDAKNYCGTVVAAGAFTLIFGLIGILASAALLLLVVMEVLGKASPFAAHVPMLANVQWVCLQAQMMIWAVSGHDPVHQANSDVKLGASWALCIVCLVLSIPTAMYFAQGVGITTKAAAPSAASTAPPATGPSAAMPPPPMHTQPPV